LTDNDARIATLSETRVQLPPRPLNLIKQYNNMTIENKLCLTQNLIDLFLSGKINEETFNETILKLG